MKIAIITDLHLGVRNDSDSLLTHQEVFFKETFFPYLDDNNIKHVLCLGDTFDKRKSICYVSLARSKEFFFDELDKRGIEYHSIIGNHDCYYKSTNDINSPDLLLREYKTFKHYWKEPVRLEFGGCKIDMIPWITKDNYAKTLSYMEKSDASIVMGHFEIKGFQMYRGSVAGHGMNAELFKKFDTVLSGHFHHKSSGGNIHYLGSPYQMNWSDYGDKRGFHVLDTNTREIVFCENPKRMFHKIIYDDSKMSLEDIKDLDISNVDGTYVKVVVKNKTNPLILEALNEKLDNADIADFKVDDISAVIELDDDIEIGEVEDLVEMLDKFINPESVDDKKVEPVKVFMKSLYIEAVSK